MADITDEKLSAFLDGELPENEAADIEQALGEDEGLVQRLEQLSRVDDLLRGAVDALEQEARPAIEHAPASAPLPANEFVSTKASAPAQAANDNPWWRVSLAASVALAVGLMAGGTLFGSAPSEPDGVQLASYTADDGLGSFLETAASGTAQPGTPGLNGLGGLQQGALEGSNVNVVEELVNMIETQRAYEMNSKAISTNDQMLQFLTNNI